MTFVFDEAVTHVGSTGVVALTPRELEVLDLVAAGLTNAEAARRLGISIHAVKFHLATIYGRLGVSNRTEAAVAYLRSSGIDAGSASGER